MTFSNLCNDIFWKSTTDYHVTDSVDAPMNNPYELKSIEYYLYLKNWIDAVQWHFEDIIRDPHIDPVAAVALKRRIDKSNQDRTDLVELIDSYFLDRYKDLKLDILLEQRKDLSSAIDQLLADIEAGKKYMKVYKQMKMYNDPALNPVLYAKK